jgi:3-hydroxybutyrate dehydrogenase
MVVKLVSWYKGRDFYDPKRHPGKELAVVVTGCDSGFGKEIALWAADAGFVVFAGCLKTESIREFADHANIHAMKMDVTCDQDVGQVVSKVKKWLYDKMAKKQRALHGLVNNAGIGIGFEVDWTDMSIYQKVMDGTHQSGLCVR